MAGAYRRFVALLRYSNVRSSLLQERMKRRHNKKGSQLEAFDWLYFTKGCMHGEVL